jgi:hypothetical protein
MSLGETCINLKAIQTFSLPCPLMQYVSRSRSVLSIVGMSVRIKKFFVVSVHVQVSNVSIRVTTEPLSHLAVSLRQPGTVTMTLKPHTQAAGVPGAGGASRCEPESLTHLDSGCHGRQCDIDQCRATLPGPMTVPQCHHVFQAGPA